MDDINIKKMCQNEEILHVRLLSFTLAMPDVYQKLLDIYSNHKHLKNYCTNTRLACSHFNSFFILVLNVNIKIEL